MKRPYTQPKSQTAGAEPAKASSSTLETQHPTMLTPR